MIENLEENTPESNLENLKTAAKKPWKKNSVS